MATLSEHHAAIQAAIDAARGEGFDVEARSCCCGEGLVIYKGPFAYSDENEDTLEFEVD